MTPEISSEQAERSREIWRELTARIDGPLPFVREHEKRYEPEERQRNLIRPAKPHETGPQNVLAEIAHKNGDTVWLLNPAALR
jgi:hypothetical protein